MEEESQRIEEDPHRPRRRLRICCHQREGERKGEGHPGEQPHLDDQMHQRAPRPLRTQSILEQEALDAMIEIPQPPQLGADRFEVVAGSRLHGGLVYSPGHGPQ
jgi:hypothetical protein